MFNIFPGHWKKPRSSLLFGTLQPTLKITRSTPETLAKVQAGRRAPVPGPTVRQEITGDSSDHRIVRLYNAGHIPSDEMCFGEKLDTSDIEQMLVQLQSKTSSRTARGLRRMITHLHKEVELNIKVLRHALASDRHIPNRKALLDLLDAWRDYSRTVVNYFKDYCDPA